MKHYIILTLLFVTILVGCIDDLTGFLGASNDIKDAKERGVFIQEYTVNPNPYKINDTLQITVKEAWLEYRWRHTKKDKEAKIEKEGYQLCINTTKENLKGLNINWTIGTTEDKYLHPSSYNSLVGDFKTKPSDTIDFPVQKGEFSFDSNKIHVIGHFIIFMKTSK